MNYRNTPYLVPGMNIDFFFLFRYLSRVPNTGPVFGKKKIYSILVPVPFYWVFFPGTNTQKSSIYPPFRIGYLTRVLNVKYWKNSLLVPGQVSDFLARGVLKVNFLDEKKRQRDLPPLDFFSKILFFKKIVKN